MTKIVVSAIMFSAALAAIPAHAQNLSISLTGIGAESCGRWTQNKQTQSIGWTEQGAWVFGYLSGAMVYSNPRGNPIHGTDAEGILAWVSDYCAAKPLSHVYEAANERTGELRGPSGNTVHQRPTTEP